MKTLAAEATTFLKEKQELVAKATHGPLVDTRKELMRNVQVVTNVMVRVSKVIFLVTTSCNNIVDAKYKLVVEALRAEKQIKGLSIEDYFVLLAGAGNDHINETFNDYVIYMICTNRTQPAVFLN